MFQASDAHCFDLQLMLLLTMLEALVVLMTCPQFKSHDAIYLVSLKLRMTEIVVSSTVFKFTCNTFCNSATFFLTNLACSFSSVLSELLAFYSCFQSWCAWKKRVLKLGHVFPDLIRLLHSLNASLRTLASAIIAQAMVKNRLLVSSEVLFTCTLCAYFNITWVS